MTPGVPLWRDVNSLATTRTTVTFLTSGPGPAPAAPPFSSPSPFATVSTEMSHARVSVRPRARSIPARGQNP
ncbi:unnamed protein product [Lampetra planeri]